MAEYGDIFDAQPVPVETELVPEPETVPESVPEPVTEPVIVGTEPVPADTVPETVETITVETIDYIPVIYDASNNICSAVLFGCLAICGVLAALKVWGFRSS